MKRYVWKFITRVGLILALLVCAFGLEEVTPVYAAALTVTNANDDGAGSLRQAIADAVDGDTIDFAADLAGQTIHLTTAELTINKTVTIANPAAPGLAISGDNARRVFNIQSSGVVTLSGLSIINGAMASGWNYGGGIVNYGHLMVLNSTLSGSMASVGGGIANMGGGDLSVVNSTLSGNWTSATGAGGGVFNNSSGQATISNSTLSGNSSYDGGGVYNNSGATLTVSASTVSGNSSTGEYGTGGGIVSHGTLTVLNSTVSGNSASYIGGGIAVMDGTSSVQNSTLSGNSSKSGGGIYNMKTSTLSNTIIANSPTGGDCRNTGTITADHTLIEASGGTACDLTNGVNGNIIGVDPLLGSLGNYGGDTQTYPLLPGSAALDAGQNCLTTDQRGVSRPQPAGGACDIGAFEGQGFTLTVNSGDGQNAAVTTAFADPLQVTVTANNPVEPVNGGVVTFTPPASGASTVLTGSPALISGGTAGVTATANSTAGSYIVSATTTGASASVDFALTNTCSSSVTVTTNADSGAGSLRQAIIAVCDGDTIDFAADLAGQTIHLTTAELTINKTVTIANPAAPGLAISGDNARRVFNIQSSGVVTLSGLSIINGAMASGWNYGGGIVNYGNLTVLNSTLSGSMASAGGGIANMGAGSLSVVNSTLSGNWTSATGAGGGVFNNSSDQATISNSTLSGNSSYDGGGVYNNSGATLTVSASTVSGNSSTGEYGTGGGIVSHGTLTVLNSTVSGNSASYIGGGIAVMDGTSSVQNSTLSGNSSKSGGGIYNMKTSTLSNTIIANSPTGGDCRNTGTITADHTLIEASGGTACDLINGVNGNIIGVDPLLGSLGNYGGDTQTYPLLPGSAALDAGQNCLTTDQRGVSRPQPAGGACDIGAFEADNHIVTFDANLGSGSMSPQTASFSTALTANTFTRTGYTFAGWNSASNGSGTAYADGATYNFAADTTLYAQWTVANHTVTFNANGGTGSMANQTNNLPAALTANAFTRTGYTFASWNTASNGSGTAYADGATYSFAADTTLYAQWTVDNHTVTFNANSGTGSMANQTNNLPAALTSNAFTRTGYTFTGWNTASNGSGTAYANGATYNFAADTTLYAQWTVDNHTVTFNANSGTGSMANQTNNLPAALTANAFTRTGYTFAGWNTASNGSGTAYANGATYNFAADTTLYAQWTVDNHTVTFNANSGTGSMANQTNNLPAALTANAFTRTGYTFAGWNTASNGSGTAYANGATYSFAADTTLYAQWTVDNHTVTFNANSGTGSMANQTNNLPAALTSNAFTRTGYTFAGWNIASNGSGTAYANGATYNFAADTTLYAQWTVDNHTVTFNANSGTGSMANQTNNLPAALTSNAFTRTGYTFAGWSTTPTGAVAYADGATYSFAADTTLYAQWTAVPPAAFGKSNPTDTATNISIAPTLLWSASSGQTDYEYCYDTAASGVCSGTWTSTSNTTSATLSGLSYNTTYRWQARAVFAGLYTYADGGVLWTFTTSTHVPTVETDPATTVTTDSATLNGMVNAWNDNTTVTFEYGLTTAYGTTVTAAESPVSGSSDTAVTYNLGGLLPDTTYHYRAVGQNSAGSIQGSDLTFTTDARNVVIATEIHNAAHGVITSAALGDSLHASATVTGNGSMAATGTVTFTAFDNPACSGKGTGAGTISLVGGVAEPGLSAILTVNSLSFRAHYNGDTNYPAEDGDCVTIFTSSYPTVLISSAGALPQDGAILTASPDNLLIQFSWDVLHGSTSDEHSAENPANYLLVAPGANGTFDTSSCGPAGTGGLKPDDTRITINSASYDPATFIVKLKVNGGVGLPNGVYRLFVCGTTSITNPTETTYLNNHASDSVMTFTVAVSSSSGSSSDKLPATGFAPNTVTALPIQSVERVYTDEALWLEITDMGLKEPIVGVPGPDWNVTWLGNQIGYLQGTAFPTWNGNSVLTGHVTNADGKPGPFAGLSTLVYGNQIIIHAWGQEYIYEVRTVNLQMDPDSTGILTRHETLPWLTLITCRDYDEKTNTYRWRTVVRAVLVKVR